MRIDNRFQQPTPNRVEGTQASSSEARRSEGVTKSPAEAQAYVPASELQAVLEKVQQQPEVRTEVVRRVSQRFAKGEYLTREAAEQTAEAFLSNP